MAMDQATMQRYCVSGTGRETGLKAVIRPVTPNCSLVKRDRNRELPTTKQQAWKEFGTLVACRCRLLLAEADREIEGKKWDDGSQELSTLAAMWVVATMGSEQSEKQERCCIDYQLGWQW